MRKKFQRQVILGEENLVSYFRRNIWGYIVVRSIMKQVFLI